ncbi:MAG TPA: ComEC/Rec2 family competence protein [Arsenicitalea sp.]|nr:ComEC/Rec2 family competence protein [Arsenicitalea sp.]
MSETAETDRIDVRAKRPPRPLDFVKIRPPQQHKGSAAKLPLLGLRSTLALGLEQRRLFVLLPFAIIAGLIAATLGSASPEPIALATVGMAIAIAVPLLWKSIAALRLLALFGAFWFGFSLLTIHGGLFGTTMLARPAYGTFQARVDEIVTETDIGRSIIVSRITPGADTRAVPIRRARIAIRDGLQLSPGDIVSAKIRFYSVPGPVLPGGFDSQFHAYFDGVGAYGNTYGAVQIVQPGEASAPDRVIQTVRRAIAARIDAVLSQPASWIARSMITGDQSGVTQEARDVMAKAGIAHVLSISGLHLTLVAGGVFAALRIGLSLLPGLSRRISVKKAAAVGGIIASVLYFSISGLNVAALRSTIMIVLVFGAVIFGRRALTMRNVAVAGLIVIIFDPASVFRPSFQLSFAAVVALVGAFETMRHEGKGPRNFLRRTWGYFYGSAITSLVAGTATLLFSAYHFQQTSPLGVLGNLLTLPLVGFIMMPAAVLSVLAMPFGFERPFLVAMGWSIDRMLDMARLVAGWSTHLDANPLLTPLALVIGFAALGWFAFFPNRFRYIGPALAVPLVILFAVDKPPDVLVADTTQAVAIRANSGLELVTGKPESFAIEVWEDTYSEPIAKDETGMAQCDTLACIATSPLGFSVSMVKGADAFEEDCASADLVIARIPAPSWCRAETTVIDADDLARQGVHWLRWDAGARKFEIRPAMTDLNRPWRAARP